MSSGAGPISSLLRFRAFASSSFDPARNLAIEEGLLAMGGEALAGDEGYLFLYVNDPCVVIGRNQNPWQETAPTPVAPRAAGKAAAGSAGMRAIYRRVSGGGTVWQDRGNLNWALVLSRNAHDREAELDLVARAVSTLGLVVKPGERGGLFTSSGAKLGGTARRFSAKSVLHHGTLLVSSDLEGLRGACRGLELAASRALPSVPSPVANLSELLPGCDLEAARTALVAALCGSEASVEPVEVLVADEAELSAAMSRHRSWDWVYGETPDFSYALPAFPGCLVSVKRGLVVGVEGPCLAAPAGFAGSRFDPGLWS